MTKTIKRDRIVCKDGFSMSVQASSFHYCSPKEDNAIEYDAVEVGFPSEIEPLLTEYSEGMIDTDPTSSVYMYVPSNVIFEIIKKHKGIISGGPLPPIKHYMSRLNSDKWESMTKYKVGKKTITVVTKND
jgi:hypothetical protein